MHYEPSKSDVATIFMFLLMQDVFCTDFAGQSPELINGDRRSSRAQSRTGAGGDSMGAGDQAEHE